MYLASRDLTLGRTVSLPFSKGQDERGRYGEFTVPRLAYWDMVYLSEAVANRATRSHLAIH